jgi:hypothetical protein
MSIQRRKQIVFGIVIMIIGSFILGFVVASTLDRMAVVP